MILSDTEILELIKTPSNENIKHWKEQHIVYDIYLNGGDVSTLLERVKNYENISQEKLRKKIAKSTKDLMSYLLNPLNKVFSANGFNEEVELKTESAKESLKETLDMLPEGLSLRDWMKTYWLDSFISDPNGIILVESKKVKEELKAYPTYKSISTVHDYQMSWEEFEYIILLHKKVKIGKEEVQLYRVYDDEKDALYYMANNKLKQYGNIEGEQDGFDEDHAFIHGKGYIPAILPSDIINKKGGKKSFIEKIDETLKEFLRDSSVHSIYKFLHGFPLYWSYATKCVTCEGEGKIQNYHFKNDLPVSDTNQIQKICPTCNGSRLKNTRDVSDGVRLPIPESNESTKLAPDIAGFVTPDLETWQMQLDEMHEMKKDMFYALWGTSIAEEQGNEKTATEVYINVQPVMDKLDSVSKTAENKENKIINYMGKIMFPESFESSNKKYGKRFLIETPDVLWEKYIKAKKDKAPISSLDYLYEQYLTSEYHNDMMMKDRKMKEFYLEPFVHYSLEDLEDIATPDQLQSKILFGQWVSDTDLDKEIDVLRTEFEKFVNDNKVEPPAVTQE